MQLKTWVSVPNLATVGMSFYPLGPKAVTVQQDNYPKSAVYAFDD